MLLLVFFFFKQKTAYEIRPCDWSSDVCSADLPRPASPAVHPPCRSVRTDVHVAQNTPVRLRQRERDDVGQRPAAEGAPIKAPHRRRGEQRELDARAIAPGSLPLEDAVHRALKPSPRAA